MVTTDLLQPAHIAFNLSPPQAQRIKLLAAAPGQEHFEVGAGMRTRFISVPAQVRGDRCAQHPLLGDSKLIENERGSYDSRCVTVSKSANALGAADPDTSGFALRHIRPGCGPLAPPDGVRSRMPGRRPRPWPGRPHGGRGPRRPADISAESCGAATAAANDAVESTRSGHFRSKVGTKATGGLSLCPRATRPLIGYRASAAATMVYAA